ncbi:MAG: hypothetical protein KBE65_07710 [Phycisphaerae bacterium]|nr:hypothetical protein [Phycisphaerae bacterium]
MATTAQIQANRSNAQKSTGPRTAEGKERASRNALKHGLLAREAVIQGEDPEEFEVYREGMFQELAPAGVVEEMLAERVVGLSWRLRRAERLQTAAFAALDDGEPEPLLEARHEEWKQIKGSDWDRSVAGLLDEDAALGKVVVEDFGGARVLDRLLMYERRIESSLYRTMAQLRREREVRMVARPREASLLEDGLPAGQEAAAGVELGSFGARPVPGGASDATRRVAGAEGRVSGDGSDFPLQTSHFKLPEITPYGVTTNEEKMPPCGAAANAADGNHGRDAHATGAPQREKSAFGEPPHGQDARATKMTCGVAANDGRRETRDERRGLQPRRFTLHVPRSIVRNEPNLGRSLQLGASFCENRALDPIGGGDPRGKGGGLSASRS